MHIVVNVNMGLAQQNIYVYDNNEIRFSTSASVSELPDVISNMSNELNINTVFIKGSQPYTEIFKEEIEKTVTTKFNKTGINVTLV